MKLNRFGEVGYIRGGVPCCRHSEPLGAPCARCAELLVTSDEAPHINGAAKETSMAMFYGPLELKDHPGRFRMCGNSDETDRALEELCSCENGHEGKQAARDCNTARHRMNEIFGIGAKTQAAHDLSRLFHYRNGSGHVAEMEQVFENLAKEITGRGLRDTEIENALRKLVEAKDAAIRALMAGRVQDD